MMKKKLAIVSLIVLSVFSLFIAGCSKKTEKYTVTFDSDGGTEIASVQVEKGKKITKPEIPRKSITFSAVGISKIPSGYSKATRLRRIRR